MLRAFEDAKAVMCLIHALLARRGRWVVEVCHLHILVDLLATSLDAELLVLPSDLSAA
jgi:hypothetical protein